MQSEEYNVTHLNWVTPEFLQNVIILDNGKWKIIDINKHCNSVTNKGDNYASSMYRIKVILSNDSDKGNETIKLSLIIKSIPKLKDLAEKIAELSVFRTEIRMLSVTIPKLTELLDNALPKEDNTLCAKFYHALESPPFNVILEDLFDSGYVLGKRREGLDLKHCEIVMKTIAKFHAASVALHEQDKAAVEIYNESAFVNLPDLIKERFKTSIIGLADVIGSLPESLSKYAEKLRNIAVTFPTKVLETFRVEKQKLNVLNHGDLWVNNMMFHYNDSTGEVEKVKFVDFQLSYYTSPALDLQYFLHTSLNEEVRIHHIEHLLKTYHKELWTFLTFMKKEEHIISYEEFIKDYEKKYILGVFASCFILPSILADPKDAQHNTNSEEALDEESGKKAAINRFSNPILINILKQFLQIFESKGVL